MSRRISDRFVICSRKNVSSSLDGLGQLTDGILAPHDYLSDENVQGIGPSGYDWIGWKKSKSNLNQTIKLEFQFENSRRISSVGFHAANLFDRDIFLFDSISISRCDDLVRRVHRKVPEDRKDSRARFLNVSLRFDEQFFADCFRIVLTFHQRSKWILISEVRFGFSQIENQSEFNVSPTDQSKNFEGKKNDENFSSFPFSVLEPSMNFVQFWFWILIGLVLLVFIVVTLIVIYFQCFQKTRENRKYRT